MPIPEFDEITKGADVNDFISSNTGSTAEMEALRQNGQGVLYDPTAPCWIPMRRTRFWAVATT